MTADELKSLAHPDALSLPLQALWRDARGEWEAAHDLAQRAGSRDGDWVHAYLHRKEGDDGNAAYWYSRAGRRRSEGPLEQEWREIADTLLAVYPAEQDKTQR